MEKISKKRLKKNVSSEKIPTFGQRTSPFKKNADRHKNLSDLIKERKIQYGDTKFCSTNNDSDYDLHEMDQKGKVKTNMILESKVTKSKKNKPKNKRAKIKDIIGCSDSDSELPEGVDSKTTIESNIWIKQKNTSYKYKAPKKPAAKGRRAQTAKKKAPKQKKGGRRKKRTTKDFCDFEVESEGGSHDEVDESGSDRYESDFICDDETPEVLEEGTYIQSEEEYFSCSGGSSNESDWSSDSEERFNEMEKAVNDGRNGQNGYRYCKDEESYYLERKFKIHQELFDKLYAHQKTGVAWLYRLFLERKGGVLADDMGLGKTCQTSVYLKGLFDSDQVKKVLIVVPATLKIYWKEEIKKWSKGLNAIIFDSKKKQEREKAINKMKKKGGILIISFGLLSTEKNLLTDIRYDTIY